MAWITTSNTCCYAKEKRLWNPNTKSNQQNWTKKGKKKSEISACHRGFFVGKEKRGFLVILCYSIHCSGTKPYQFIDLLNIFMKLNRIISQNYEWNQLDFVDIFPFIHQTGISTLSNNVFFVIFINYGYIEIIRMIHNWFGGEKDPSTQNHYRNLFELWGPSS